VRAKYPITLVIFYNTGVSLTDYFQNRSLPLLCNRFLHQSEVKLLAEINITNYTFQYSDIFK